MLYRRFFLALTLVLAFALASAQRAFEYALLIVNQDGYTFEAPDAGADGFNADDFYFNLTGEELPGGAPVVSILSAIGGSGWELASVDSSSPEAVTYYFKREY